MTNEPVDPDRSPGRPAPGDSASAEPTGTTEPPATTEPVAASAEPTDTVGTTGPDEPTDTVGPEEPAGPDEPTDTVGPEQPGGPDDRTEPVAASAAPSRGDVPPHPGPFATPPGGFPPPTGFPPTAGFPPPGGFPPPPPGTGGWATRYGLVRPAQGRMLAGVCAAVGRATNTDPVLWRVLFAVLTLAGGVGLLAYVLGWLLIPAEGDTASPVEGLLGRGRSSTSPVLVIIVGIIAAIALGSVLYNGLRSAAILLAVILGAIILISRGGNGARTVPPVDPGTAAGGLPDDRTAVVPPPPPTWAAAPPAGVPAPPAQPSGYRPPFAPHGPYAATSRYPYPGLAQTVPPVPQAPPPFQPVPARTRSRLGRVTLSLGLLVLGVLAVIDIAGAHVPFFVYAGALLAVVGLGLLIGAWFGRARWLIPLGLVLALAGAIGLAPHNPNMGRGGGDVTITPASVEALDSMYHQGFGDFTLDLTKLDFTGADKDVRIMMSVGDLKILLPPRVDTTVHAKVNLGDARVFDSKWGGVGSPARDVADNDTDGLGGGTLRIDIQLNAGDLEVHR